MNPIRYIGIPFRPHGRGNGGYDCIGLVLDVLKNEFGHDVPDAWNYDDPHGRQVAQTFLLEMANADTLNSRWRPCGPQAGAVVLFRIGGMVRHIGVMIDETRFLHTMEGVATCIERVDSVTWKKRIAGYYRWSS